MNHMFIYFILSVILTFIIARVISSKVIKIALPAGDRNITIDGIRGYLSIGVVFHHYYFFYNWINTGEWIDPDIDYIKNIGHMAVYVFFIITGYLFIGRLLSFEKAKKDINWFNLFSSRFFRIIPLYVAVIVFTFFISYSESGFTLNITKFEAMKEVLRWATFTGWTVNGDPNARLIHAGVTWTLRYEWLFYISLPLIALIIKKKSVIAALTALVVLLFFFPISGSIINTHYFILFVLGGYSYYITNNFKKVTSILKGPISSCACLLFASFSLYFDSSSHGYLIVLSASLIFITVASGNSFFGLLTNKTSRLLGEISYSIYLTHGAVIYIVLITLDMFNYSFVKEHYMGFLMLIMPLICISSMLTFKAIESPGMALGRRLKIK